MFLETFAGSYRRYYMVDMAKILHICNKKAFTDQKVAQQKGQNDTDTSEASTRFPTVGKPKRICGRFLLEDLVLPTFIGFRLREALLRKMCCFCGHNLNQLHLQLICSLRYTSNKCNQHLRYR